MDTPTAPLALIRRARAILRQWFNDATAAPWSINGGCIPGVANETIDGHEEPCDPMGEEDARLIAGLVGSELVRQVILDTLEDPLLDTPVSHIESALESRVRARAARMAEAIVGFETHSTHTPRPEIPVGALFRADLTNGTQNRLLFAAEDDRFFHVGGAEVRSDQILNPTVHSITPPPA